MTHASPHLVGEFTTCLCSCSECWNGVGVPSCLCPYCDDDEHDHMGREPQEDPT